MLNLSGESGPATAEGDSTAGLDPLSGENAKQERIAKERDEIQQQELENQKAAMLE